MKRTLSNISGFFAKRLAFIVILIAVLILGSFVAFGNKNEDGTITFDGTPPTYTESQENALCELKTSLDESISGITGANVPQDGNSGCDPTDIAQLGALPYYDVDVSSPTAFYNAVNGKGFNEGYGLQCVAAFKEYQFALSGKYVATSTGGAKGYANQQSQIEPLGFKWFAGQSGMKDGDWAIFGMGQYGHVAMYYKGQFFSQNQYAADPNVGNPFNLASISKDTILGYYRPNIYVAVDPTPSPNPDPDNGGSTGGGTSNSYTVRRGDTLGGISLGQGWYIGTKGLYGDSGYTQRLAERNGIQNRGVIYPNQVIQRAE